LEGSVVVALEAGFELVDGFYARAGVGIFERIGVADLQLVFAVCVGEHLVGDEGGFHVAEPADAPFGVEHGFDFVALGGSGGCELGEIFIAELVIVFLGFAGEDDRAGVHAVFNRVLGGSLFAWFGFGAAGFGAIAAGGFRAVDVAGCCHKCAPNFKIAGESGEAVGVECGIWR
jgi:hypothetical protein